MRQLLSLAAGLILALTMMSASHAQLSNAQTSTSELVAYFGDVALGKKAGSKIVKWTRPPIVRMETITASASNYDEIEISETNPADFEFLQDHVNHLRTLTGLPIRLLPRDLGVGGDIVITIAPWHLVRRTAVRDAPPGLLRRLMGPGRCFFVLWTAPKSGIKKAHIIINSKLDKRHIRHCLLEEITQSMGLPYDSDRLRPSIFNEATREPALSEYDSNLVRTLYDPRMTTGMDRAAAISIATAILKSATIRAD